MVGATAPAYVATREALTVLSPQDLTSLRFLGAAAVLGLYLLVNRQRLRITRRDVPRLLAAALCGYAGFGLLLSLGQSTVPAGTTSLLLNISPVFAFILGYFVLVERTTTLGYIGMVVAVGGVVIVTFGDSTATGFDENALLIVGAALLLSVFLIVQQPLLARVPAVEIVFWSCAIGGIGALPLATFDADPAQVTTSFWMAIVVLVVLSTVLANSMWNVTLKHSSVAEGGSLLLVVPIFSLLLGWLVLGEAPSLAAIGGGAIALAGVVMLSQATSRRKLAGPGLLTGAIPIIDVHPGLVPIVTMPLTLADLPHFEMVSPDAD
ncbi:DMT family transporter [Cryobacterium psychrophilum]|nr:DMT family transporter [Cryobacterium psychrophilum]TDW30257.1 drug/metabolite transporter (DMT)-like permease [Cryobacterium psychrophilum]